MQNQIYSKYKVVEVAKDKPIDHLFRIFSQ